MSSSSASVSKPRLVYVLELADRCFYVGVTEKSLKARFDEHALTSDKGAAWTRRHRPVRILDAFVETGPHDENVKTKELMSEHGIDRVRGGSYTMINLSLEDRRALQRELEDVGGKCRGCGKTGHFVAQCPTRRTKTARSMSHGFSHSSYRSPAPPRKRAKTYKSKAYCTICYRTTHTARDCYASTTVDGEPISDDDDYY